MAKFGKKIKLDKLNQFLQRNHLGLVDGIFVGIILGISIYLHSYYSLIWDSNKTSLILVLPFLLIFVWTGWHRHKKGKAIRLDNILTAAGLFLAAWIFIYQTTDSSNSKTNLVLTANTFNCQNASVLSTLNPNTDLLLRPFSTEPYLNNPEVVFNMYGPVDGGKVMSIAYDMKAGNNLIDLVFALNVQGSNPFLTPYTGQMILKYNSQLIQLASSTQAIICNQKPQQPTILEKIKKLFRRS